MEQRRLNYPEENLINIIAVGKLKKDEYKTLADDYLKRIGRFQKINLMEVKDEDCDADSELAVKKEGEAILAKLPKGSYVIACDPRGVKMSSEAFAAKFENLYNSSVNNICFVIGGSAGLSDDVRAKADMLLSFSDFTFAHNLFRVILTEQIYRAHKIINHETYHK